jgi:dihydroxyacetone kinase
MEMGIGHHGEPGVAVGPLGTASEVADEMLRLVMEDHALAGPTDLCVLVSGLGATPVNELYLLYGRVAERLEATGHRVHRAFVGNLFTSLEMMGATLTVMALDDELRALLDAPAACVGLTVGAAR